MNWGFYPIVTAAPIAIAVTAAGSLVVWFLWWAWWRLPKQEVEHLQPMIMDPAARSGAEDNIRKTVGQAIGGILVLLAAGLAYYGTLQTMQINEDQAQRTQQSARDLLISNQVSKGFEQLASKDTVMQLGGIYALEGVMNASEQYHQPVLETLCAFVRDRTNAETGNGPPATEIQAALTVIGRRRAIERVYPDLHNAHIPQADLRNADLRGAILYNADLRGADLRGADLRRAFLLYPTQPPIGEANLGATPLTSADLRGAAVKQAQLDRACGADVKLDAGLTIKPCR
jgi:hypothetical protein